MTKLATMHIQWHWQPRRQPFSFKYSEICYSDIDHQICQYGKSSLMIEWFEMSYFNNNNQLFDIKAVNQYNRW